MDEMFADLGKSLMSDIKNNRDAKWKQQLAQEIFDNLKILRMTRNIILHLLCITNQSLVRKNDKLAQQLPELRNEILDSRGNQQTIRAQVEEKLCKLTQGINFEKRDIGKRTNTIAELESRLNEFK